jgi:hypothetical protein
MRNLLAVMMAIAATADPMADGDPVFYDDGPEPEPEPEPEPVRRDNPRPRHTDGSRAQREARTVLVQHQGLNRAERRAKARRK